MLVGIIHICTHSRIHSSEKLGRLLTERKVGDLCFERRSIYRYAQSSAGHGAATSAARAAPGRRGAEGLWSLGVMAADRRQAANSGIPLRSNLSLYMSR